MATKVFLQSQSVSDTHRGEPANTEAGASVGWRTHATSTIQGTTVDTFMGMLSVAGPTAGIEFQYNNGGTAVEMISPPLSADVTISGTITFNVWGTEGAMTTNAGPQIRIDRLDSQLGIASTIVDSEAALEFGTTAAAINWTATPTSTAMKKGDRFRIVVLANDAGGTMGASSQLRLDTNGPAAADGDSYVSFTETFTFDTANPSGTQLFLTSTAGQVTPGSATTFDAWTSRGGGSTTSVTNTVTGWTSGVQITATAGGTAIEWFTHQLNAFTLGGRAMFNLRLYNASGVTASARGEIAICDASGNLVAVWAAADLQPGSNNSWGKITTTTDTFGWKAYASGADTAVTNGQRLRFRIFLDDTANSQMSPGQTITMSYNGTSASAAGDSYVTLPQSVTEYVPAAAASLPLPRGNQLQRRYVAGH